MEYINIKNGYTKEILEQVTKIIQDGGVVILPTDTVYGIAVDSFNEKAIKRVYDLKSREKGKPVNIVVSNINMIEDVTSKITNSEKKVIEKFFPGALTIIFEKNEKILDIVTAGKDTIRN